MGNVPDTIQTWQMIQPFKKDRETGEVTPGKLEKAQIPVPELGSGGCAGGSGRMRRLPYGSGLFLSGRTHSEQTAVDTGS